MRVLVPFYGDLLHPRVIPSLVSQVDADGNRYVIEQVECVNIVGHPFSYPALLADWLTCGADVCIVEHDNESRPGFLAGFESCPEPWCFHAYDLSVPWEDAVGLTSDRSAPLGLGLAPLGHTRFRAGVGDLIAETLDAPWFRETWVSRDTFISGALNALGMAPHRHPGKAGHHHPYPRD
jgi:hypothetical protein